MQSHQRGPTPPNEAESRHRDSGHTLIELLLALVIVGIGAGIPVVSLTRTITRLEAAASARVWESGAATAQIQAIWGGSPSDLSMYRHGLEVISAGACVTATPPVGVSAVPVVNVSRWAREGAVNVRFLPGFGSPDGAGSLYFGSEGAGERVILRLESGLARRTRW